MLYIYITGARGLNTDQKIAIGVPVSMGLLAFLGVIITGRYTCCKEQCDKMKLCENCCSSQGKQLIQVVWYCCIVRQRWVSVLVPQCMNCSRYFGSLNDYKKIHYTNQYSCTICCVHNVLAACQVFACVYICSCYCTLSLYTKWIASIECTIAYIARQHHPNIKSLYQLYDTLLKMYMRYILCVYIFTKCFMHEKPTSKFKMGKYTYVYIHIMMCWWSVQSAGGI